MTITNKLSFRLGQDQSLDKHPPVVKDHPKFWLEPESGKKSSFLFQCCGDNNDQSSSSPVSKFQKPCHLIIECVPYSEGNGNSDDERETETETLPWLFGGMEIFSNSRNIEVYAVPEGKDDVQGKEYWQTHRGSKVDIDINTDGDDDDDEKEKSSKIEPKTKDACEQEIYQTVILPPSSKPATVQSIHLKLLSLRPAKCTVAFVKCLKLKGRIPESVNNVEKVIVNVNAPSDSATHNRGMGQGQSSNANANTNQTIIPSRNKSESTEQIASAISGLSMIINNVRGTMESSIQSTIGEFQSMAFQHNQTWNDRFAAFEKNVAELKDGVDLLNTNVNLLRNEQMLQVEEVQSLKIQLKGDRDRDRKDNDDSDGNSGTDTDIHQVLGGLLLDQRQWMVEQMQKQKDEMIAEVVQQLDSTSKSKSSSITADVNVDADTNASVNKEDEMIYKSQALEEDVSIAIVECEDG